MKDNIIWTNGCFDVLHRGHIELFKFAKSLGSYLVVGVDSDSRVKNSKGPTRPINNLEDRVAMLQSISYIDEVKTFGCDKGLEHQIKSCGASTIVVGDDYKHKNVIGSHLVEKVVFFEKINGYSTSKIIQHSADR